MLEKFFRFLAGNAVGVFLDFCVAAFVLAIGYSPAVACVAGFLSAVVVTYWVHLRWTFKVSCANFLSLYLVKFFASSVLTLCFRLGVIFIGERVIVIDSQAESLVLLIVAVGFSFFMNFVLSICWTFHRGK